MKSVQPIRCNACSVLIVPVAGIVIDMGQILTR